jgi:hypothetical protein
MYPRIDDRQLKGNGCFCAKIGSIGSDSSSFECSTQKDCLKDANYHQPQSEENQQSVSDLHPITLINPIFRTFGSFLTALIGFGGSFVIAMVGGCTRSRANFAILGLGIGLTGFIGFLFGFGF